MRGEAQIVIPDSSNPRYCVGHLRVLFEHEGLDEIVNRRGQVFVCDHDVGLGEWRDRDALIEDLEREGFFWNTIPVLGDRWRTPQ